MQEDVRRLLHSHVNIHTWIGSGREDEETRDKNTSCIFPKRERRKSAIQSHPIHSTPLYIPYNETTGTSDGIRKRGSSRMNGFKVCRERERGGGLNLREKMFH